MRNAALLVAIALSGWIVGGGPYAGYGAKRGFVYGVEAGAGLPVAQVAVGIQNQDRFAFFRVDGTGNSAHFRDALIGGGGRLGGGYGTGKTHTGGVFAFGGNVGYQFDRARCLDAEGPGKNGTAAIFGLEYRYAAGEDQFVATSRLERYYTLCVH